MSENKNKESAQPDTSGKQDNLVHAPTLNLPKGGGAIHGIGEKFAANPVTGTGSMSIPIATSPGRSGFGPQLSLSYDSGAGNGPFGLGWNLSLPTIARKTDKGLPYYNDADESDVFLLSGSEDLVPVLANNLLPAYDDKSAPGYIIYFYRPRIEGLFADIERWLNTTSGESHWRTISKDNITTIFGKTENSRIVDPDNSTHIFSWLISESYDDKGNAILYEYKQEDTANIQLTTQANERNRTRSANRYLKRIKYGNTTPRQNNEALILRKDWLFEVVFDYGEHYEDTANQTCTIDFEGNNHTWPVRTDPFSTYRPGFEVRTYRLCRRILMFYHFKELGTPNYLVKSTGFKYAESPVFSLISSVTQSGYERDHGNTYHKRSLPPLKFTYSQAVIQDKIHELDDESLRNLPEGLDGVRYQWVDLDGEGLTGILTEQADAWYYKRNIGNGSFAEQALVARKPSLAALASGRQQLLDLAGDGQLDLVELEPPLAGFYERTVDENWDPFVPFKSLPNIAWHDPNLKFIDLTGDGHADVLISEDNAFTWYGSLAEAGFGPAQRVNQTLEEERGPRLVFADGTQSIYLADMSGDGLTDLVRIRNTEVCYWPNLGYGRFGTKVTMDNAPHFDYPDQFDQRRIRLADIDGSGLVDIIYLATDGVKLYFNQSGNGFSPVRTLAGFPKIDNLSAVQVVDLFGNGTACLLWSSPLPGAARSPLRYIDLIGSNKPHLLLETTNNFGGKTVVEYVASTQFYLADKAAGNPWITKLPFPVHVVARVTVIDHWRNTEFSSTYSYHHGYFDGIEREFRGFGRVEQVDVESYGKFEQGNIASPYITDNHELYQPPIKTITWYHTGAAIDRQRILTQFEQEYFPARYLQGTSFNEKALPEPELTADLSADEWREALRACKGMVLRQESYELDVDAIHAEISREVPVRLYSTATHNCHIECLQRKATNQHAVFLVTESEAITYNYELDLITKPFKPDPRIAHTLNLRHDVYGNPQQSVAITYGRVVSVQQAELPNTGAINIKLINEIQEQTHIAYTETRYTNDIILPEPAGTGQIKPTKHYRLRLPYEVRTYEITGIPTPANLYFTIENLRNYTFCEDSFYPPTVPTGQQISLTSLQYHQQPQANTPHRRIVEHACTRYFDDGDDSTGKPKTPLVPLPLGQLGTRGLKYEDYKLALTDDLLDAVFKQFNPETGALLDDKLAWEIDSGITTRERFAEPIEPDSHYLKSGYILGIGINSTLTDQYWMRSGTAGFAHDANSHFYLPEEYTDPFGNKTRLIYDLHDLYVQSSQDALGNTGSITRFDYRVLAPSEMIDANGNHSEVVFDILGLPVAAAIKGKELAANKWEGDDLTSFDFSLRNPSSQAIQAFCTATEMDETAARDWLGRATTRFVYHFGDENGEWNKRMAGACSIKRERHQSQVDIDTETDIKKKHPIQVSLECSDGGGNVLMKKVQAEPDPTLPVAEQKLRWIINGLTVLNNKGKPVKQYEPAFSSRFGCEPPQANGVTTVIYYDAAGRVMRTEMPDGSYSRVEFSPWHVLTFDANDTAYDPDGTKHSDWYNQRIDPNHPEFADFNTTENIRAADLVKAHANTPALTLLDSLGRDVIAIAHNRVEDVNGTYIVGTKKYRNEYYTTYTKLDAEGKPLWICDAHGNLVMQYINPPKPNHTPLYDATGAKWRPVYDMPSNAVPCYDIAGNLLFQHSMDAGDRWMINDAAGKPLLAWDINERQDSNNTMVSENRLYSTECDALHRPAKLWLKINDASSIMVERYEYRDTQLPDDTPNPQLDQDKAANLIGQLVRHYDSSGLIETIALDFKGSPIEVHRRLVSDGKSTVTDWQNALNADGTSKLETETFIQITEYDALKRMTRLYNWHRENKPVAVYLPKYSERGVLKSEALIVGATKTNTSEGYTGGKETNAIDEIRYDAKGQREYLKLGNGAITTYTYDPNTFRLVNLHTWRGKNETCSAGTGSVFVDDHIIQDLHYWYDPVGNITEIHDPAFKDVFFLNQKVEPISRYEYDALYRLINATGRENAAATGAPSNIEAEPLQNKFPCLADNALRNYTQTYQYDSVGNIKQMCHVADLSNGNWTRHYDYAFDDPDQQASNRLWRTWQGDDNWDSTKAINKVTYTYDTHGSMLNLANVPDEFRMQWDHRDMIGVINLGNGFAHYQYDVGKQRTRKFIDRSEQITAGNTQNIVEERIYLGGMELYRRWVNDVLKQEIETLHLFDGEQRLLMVDQIDDVDLGKRDLYRYTLSNHLGSATLELDETADIISYEEYHPYGTSAYRAGRNAAEVKLKRYRYTGMERDDESGLSYHRARYYALWLGRWASCDPVGDKDSLNAYSFVKANPVCFFDPNGANAEAAVMYRTALTHNPMRPENQSIQHI
ncbi:MAG: SpvB/TcaC N-terminal domain-containing protein, partial [Methylococcaceae bacterium]